MKYKDKLQAKLEAIALKDSNYAKKSLIDWGESNEDTKIGLLMLQFNVFYEEMKQRWEQAKQSIKNR